MMKYYMHTIDGRPACYEKGRQIVYAGFYQKAPLNMLATSLDQIKAEQALTRKWREKQGIETLLDYGYIRVYTPDSD